MRGYTHFLSAHGFDKRTQGVGYGYLFDHLTDIEHKMSHGSTVSRFNISKKTYPNRIELKIFNNYDFLIGKSSEKKASPIVKENKQKTQDYKTSNDNRSKQKFMDLIECNVKGSSYFWTYTFADEIKDLKQANYEFKKFIQRLKYELNKTPKYICVPELQKENDRDVWHFHAIFFDLGYFDFEKMTSLWSNGFVWVKRIKENNGLRIAHYMAKYLTKSNDLEKSKKKYFASRNLERPKNEWVRTNDVIHLFDNYPFNERASINDFLGLIRYYSFDLKKSTCDNHIKSQGI